VYNSNYYFFPANSRGRGTRGFCGDSLSVQLGGTTNIQGGRGNVTGEVYKIVHACHPHESTQTVFDIFLVSQILLLSQDNSNSVEEDGSRKIWERSPTKKKKKKKKRLILPCTVSARGIKSIERIRMIMRMAVIDIKRGNSYGVSRKKDCIISMCWLPGK